MTHSTDRETKSDYELVTAAYNEEKYVGQALESIVKQTVTPKKWIVVSDGSTDATDQIVQSYASRYEFIELLRITKEHARNFAAQVVAINTGFAKLRSMEYALIGNLDADISVEADYFSRLIGKFERDCKLGVAGGYICESNKGAFEPRPTNRTSSVPHGVQLFRRECLQALGGYLPLPYGGPDWHAEVSARMLGWHVESFPDLPAYHHRPTGTAAGLLRYWFRQGLMDFSLGVDLLFEVVKLLGRVSERPFVLGSVTRLGGFHMAGDILRNGSSLRSLFRT